VRCSSGPPEQEASITNANAMPTYRNATRTTREMPSPTCKTLPARTERRSHHNQPTKHHVVALGVKKKQSRRDGAGRAPAAPWNRPSAAIAPGLAATDPSVRADRTRLRVVDKEWDVRVLAQEPTQNVPSTRRRPPHRSSGIRDNLQIYEIDRNTDAYAVPPPSAELAFLGRLVARNLVTAWFANNFAGPSDNHSNVTLLLPKSDPRAP
jgi:hypothetical protein